MTEFLKDLRYTYYTQVMALLQQVNNYLRHVCTAFADVEKLNTAMSCWLEAMHFSSDISSQT